MSHTKSYYEKQYQFEEEELAAQELARMLFAVSTILEESSSKVGLSKRAALALAIMSLEGGSGKTFNNTDLQTKFLEHNISTPQSAKKDASAAKSELLEAGHIAIRGRVSVFGLTDSGQDTVHQMNRRMSEALDGLGLSDQERAVLRDLVGMPPEARPPKPELGNHGRRKNSQTSS